MKIFTYLKEVKAEFIRISYPNRRETFITVAVVLLASLVASLFFFLTDSVIHKFVSFILNT